MNAKINAASMPDDPLAAGTLVGEKFRIMRHLGSGGMGAVYEAENTWTMRKVAVKVLSPGLSRSAQHVQRFRQEAIAATMLKHPHIVDVLDMGEDAALGSVYIVQEFLLGNDLRARLDETGPMEVREALDIVLPILSALSAAHGKGILHRDVKPENVFLLKEDHGGVTPKLIDFGIAKFVADENRRVTNTGVMLGTPCYMSPEQVLAEKTIDARADVWSVAAMLFEMLSGRVPFDGTSAAAVMARIISEKVQRIEQVRTDLPPVLADVIHRALESDRERRTPTAEAFLAELMACPYLPGGRIDDGLRAKHLRTLQLARAHLEHAPTDAGVAPPPDDHAAEVRRATPLAFSSPGALAPKSRPIVPFIAVGAAAILVGIAIGLALRGSPAATQSRHAIRVTPRAAVSADDTPPPPPSTPVTAPAPSVPAPTAPAAPQVAVRAPNESPERNGRRRGYRHRDPAHDHSPGHSVRASDSRPQGHEDLLVPVAEGSGQ